MFKSLRKVRQRIKRHGVKHVAGRVVEFGLLQNTVTSRAYWRLVPHYYNFKYSRELRQYESPPDPFKLRYVDPDKIKYISGRGPLSEGALYDVGAVLGGDWDRHISHRENSNKQMTLKRFEEHSIHRLFVDHFENGVPWRETDFIERVEKKVADGDTTWHNCRSKKDIIERCEFLDNLYEDIRQNGYKTQRELRDSPPALSDDFGFLNEHVMEVAVDIGRNGEVLFLDGRHRLSIAKILDLGQIPVMVIARHKKWMDFRERQSRSESPEKHPDLVDLR